MKLVNLEKVANVEKVFPGNWFKGEGQGFTEDFSAYCLPLLGADKPEYACLTRYL
jgi:hypothetical protein